MIRINIGPLCHLCGVSLESAPVVADTARHGHASRRVACERCGLVQVSPQPDRAELMAYYRERYRQEYTALPIATGDGPVMPDHPAYSLLQRRLAEDHASLIVSHASGRDVLELGSGEGHIAIAIRDRGYRVTAIEPDEACAAHLTAASIMVLPDWASADLPGASFDAVVAIHSLEHLHDPRAFLSFARRLLRPTGALIVEVPSVLAPYGDLDTWFFQHVHLYDFSPDTLAAFLMVSGFRVREMQTSTTRRRFLLAVAEPATDVPAVDFGRLRGGHWIAGYLDRYRAEMRGAG